MNTRTHRTAHGFSLLELTLVIAIMGVLMAIAAYNLLGGADDAKKQATIQSMQVIKNAMNTYNARNNAYPPNIQTLIQANILEAGADLDGWKRPFYFSPVGKPDAPIGQRFTLISMGSDGLSGTEDDIDIWVALNNN